MARWWPLPIAAPTVWLRCPAASYLTTPYNVPITDCGSIVHPQLRAPETGVANRHQVRQDGSTVWSMLWRDAVLPSGLMKMFWPDGQVGDARAHMRWNAPSVMFLDVGIKEINGTEESGVAVPSVHLLTPETQSTTHYFYAFLRNRRLDDDELTKRIAQLGYNAFANEDRPIIEAQQLNIGSADIMDCDLAWLEQDAAAARVRQIMGQLIAEERQTDGSTGAE
jgi:hypothetical protein